MSKDNVTELGDIDWDTNLDLFSDDFGDEDSINKEVGKEERKPINRVYKGLLKEVKSNATDISVLKSIVKDSLPKEYKYPIDALSEFKENITGVYSDAVKELRPKLQNITKQIDKLMPDEATYLKKITKKLSDRFDSGDRYNYDYNRKSEEDTKAEELVQTIFELNRQQNIKDDKQEIIRDKIDEKRSNTLLSVLNSINTSVSRLNGYTEDITNAYQRKSLELQYRSYYVQSELLKTSKEYYNIFKAQNEGIIQNTGLPDYLKLKQSENFSKIMKDKLFENIREGIFGNGDFLKKSITNLRNKVLSGVSTTGFGLDMLGMQMDMVPMMLDMDMDFGPTDKHYKRGKLAGKGVNWLLGSLLSHNLGKGLSKIPGVNEGGFKATKYARNIPSLLRDIQESEFVKKAEDRADVYGLDKFNRRDEDKDFKGRVGDWFKRKGRKISGYAGLGTKSILDMLSPEYSGVDLSIKRKEVNYGLNDPAIFDGITKKSVVSVIPGFLSRIYREIQVLRTGNDKIQLTSYDYTREKFSSKDNLTKSITSIISKDVLSQGYGRRLDYTVEKLDKNNKLSTEAKEGLRELVHNVAIKGDSLDIKSLMKDENFKNLDPKVAEELKQHLQTTLVEPEGYGERDLNLVRMLDNLKNSSGDIRQTIQTLYDLGYKDILIQQGIVTKDEYGRIKINKDKYSELLLESSKDLNNNDNKPKYNLNSILDNLGITVKDAINTTTNNITNKANELYTNTKSTINEGISNIGNFNMTDTGQLVQDRLSELKSKYKTKKEEIKIYLKDSILPVITEEDLNDGKYIDVLTNKVITNIKDITGPVIDKLGKIIISESDIKDGLYDKNNKIINIKLNKLIPSIDIKDRIKEFGKRGLNALSNINGLNNIQESFSGLPIGNTTKYQATPFDLTSVGSAIGKIGKKGLEKGKKLVGLFRKNKSKIAEDIDQDSKIEDKNIEQKPNKTKNKTNITTPTFTPVSQDYKINSIANPKFANSAIGQLESMERKKQEREKNKPVTASLDVRYKSEQNAVDWMMDKAGSAIGNMLDGLDTLKDLFGKSKGKLGGVFKKGKGAGKLLEGLEGKTGNIIKGTGDLLSKGSTIEKIGSAAEVAETAAEVAVGKGAVGKASTILKSGGASLIEKLSKVKDLKNIGNVLKIAGYGRNALLAGEVVEGAMGAGAMAAGTEAILAGLGTGLAAIGTFLASPVVIGTIVLGAAIYGGYKLYQYVTRDDITVLETIRFRQYGLTEKHKSQYHKILALEDLLLSDIIKYQGNDPYISDKFGEKINDILDIFDINAKDDRMLKRFLEWFNNRFKVIFLLHLKILKSINKDKDLKDIEKLSDDEKLRYINASMIEYGPYDNTTSPFAEFDNLSSSNSGVIEAIENAKKGLKEKQDKDLKKLTLESKEGLPGFLKGNSPNHQFKPEVKEGLPEFLKGQYKSANDFNSQVQNTNTEGEPPNALMKVANQSNMDRDTSNIINNTPSQLSKAVGDLKDGSKADQYLKVNSNVDLSGVNPLLLQNFKGMVQEYGELTGKTVTISSAYRSRAKQTALYNAASNKSMVAKPGHSLHEFGLALDVGMPGGDGLNQMEKLGLMRKYGFTRPVGGEPWHTEPAGIEVNIQKAKDDPNFASQAISSSIGRGGGGLGTISGSRKGGRDTNLAISLLGDDVSKDIKIPNKDNIEDSIINKPVNSKIASDTTDTGFMNANYNTTVVKPINKPIYNNPINATIDTNTGEESTTGFKSETGVNISSGGFAGNVQNTSKGNASLGFVNGGGFKENGPALMNNLMKDYNLTPVQAAGIVGNLAHESAGLVAGKEEIGGGGGLGWAQWTGARRKEFVKYLNDTGQSATDPSANYGFLKYELDKKFRDIIPSIRNTNSVEASTRVWHDMYEKSGDIKNGVIVKPQVYNKRVNYAAKALNITSGSSIANIQPKINSNTTKPNINTLNNTSNSGFMNTSYNPTNVIRGTTIPNTVNTANENKEDWKIIQNKNIVPVNTTVTNENNNEWHGIAGPSYSINGSTLPNTNTKIDEVNIQPIKPTIEEPINTTPISTVTKPNILPGISNTPILPTYSNDFNNVHDNLDNIGQTLVSSLDIQKQMLANMIQMVKLLQSNSTNNVQQAESPYKDANLAKQDSINKSIKDMGMPNIRSQSKKLPEPAISNRKSI